MHLIIRVLLNSQGAQLRTVQGACMSEEVAPMDIEDRAVFDARVCAAVWNVLNDNSAEGMWEAILRPLARDYGRCTRSLRLGDVVTVWVAQRADDCAQTRLYEATARGFVRKSRLAVPV